MSAGSSASSHAVPSHAADTNVAWAERATFVLAALLTVLVLAHLLQLSRHGLDFTDEGYYLAWIANPYLYDASSSQFGFVYHALYLALDGNIVALRAANLLLTFGLAWLAFASALRSDASERAGLRWKELVVSAVLACSALLIFRNWLTTPNYNSLTVQALLLASFGLISCVGASPGRWTGALALGVGGALAFLAKPTSAAILALVAGSVLLLAGRQFLRLALVAATAAILVLFAFALGVDGGPGQFIRRLQDGAELMQLADGRYGLVGIFRYDALVLTREEWRFLALSTGVVALGASLLRHSRPALVLLGLAISGVLIALGYRSLFASPIELQLTQFAALLVAGGAIGAVMASILRVRRGGAQSPARWTFLAAGIALLPFALAFGSNNNYWHVAGGAGALWCLAGTLRLRAGLEQDVLPRTLLPLAALSQLVTVSLLLLGASQPYRQSEALPDQRHRADSLPGGRGLHVSAETAAYLGDVKRAADTNHLVGATPAIDLTGQSPSTMFALGVRQIGLPWWAGGLPGSERLAAWAIDRLPCEQLGAAWLLVEPGGPRALPSHLVTRFGADIERDFVNVATFRTPPGAGGFPEPRVQYLLRPAREAAAAAAACKALATRTERTG